MSKTSLQSVLGSLFDWSSHVAPILTFSTESGPMANIIHKGTMNFELLSPAVALLLLVLLVDRHCSEGFAFGGGWSPPPRTPNSHRLMDGSFHDASSEETAVLATFTPDPMTMEENLKKRHSIGHFQNVSRGGSTGVTENVMQQSTPVSGALALVGTSLTSPLRRASKAFSSVFRSKEKFMEEKLMKELSTMPVERIKVMGNSSVFPPEVVELAARRAGIIGRPLQPDSVQEFARALKRWYSREGYVLNSLKAANLRPETATAELVVEEPLVSEKPVDIVFCQQLAVDGDTGELLTLRQYKDKHFARKGRSKNRKKFSLADANTTLVETSGRTKPSKIASALKLHSGRPFRWDERRWEAVSGSGIFSSVLNVSPQLLDDGTVQLQIVVLEEKGSHVQYGLGRSGYTGAWAGDLNFEKGNLFGGGESIGVTVARGPTDKEPSVRFRFSNSNFGLDGGYEVEAFTDYIGSKSSEPGTQLGGIETLPGTSDGGQKHRIESSSEESTQETSYVDAEIPPPETAVTDVTDATELDYDHDALVNRRGATLRVHNPFEMGFLQSSVASCSLERTSTMTGLHENIGSCSLFLGPFSQKLSLLEIDARSNIDCKLLGGSRVQRNHGIGVGKQGWKLVPSRIEKYIPTIDIGVWPYAAGSVTARQTFPLLSTKTRDKRDVVFALLHSITTSTPYLPRHEARAQAIANKIRGATEDGRITGAVRGTAELRFPIDIPKIQTKQDGRIVVFADWLVASPDYSRDSFYGKSCVGLGLRKSVQGIPVRYDLCYTKEGKTRHSVGIGLDFEA